VTIRARSGRRLDDVTVEAAVRGELTPDDLRIDERTLRRQADVAERSGNRQLAENLRRAAELTTVDDDDLIAMYDALRPRRSTAAQLDAIATRLDAAGAAMTARLVREAAEVYARRGLLA
jgi:propanediol dehydratase small subunit